MWTIKLPEPPSSNTGMPEIFDRGISCVVRRAVIIGNGAVGAEHQCIGLVRALGLTNSHTLHRVNRPDGGFIDIYLRWLPIPIHKKLDFLLRHIQTNWRRLPLPGILSQLLGKSGALSPDSGPPAPRGGHGLHALIMDEKPVPEADANHIAALALEDLDREGPLLVVASGRDTITLAAAVKRLAPEATFVVQILHPRRGLDRFDMVFAPIHDYHTLTPAAHQEVPKLLLPWITPQQPPDKHVVLTVGALHHADASTLRAAATAWQSELASLAKPLLIVNVGFPTRCCRYGEDLALELVSALNLVLTTCGSCRITFSQRTTSQIVNCITREIGQHPKVSIWDGRGPNPHFGHLAWGDAFVVTADSVSMLSEACSTGKPVYVVGGDRCRWKFTDFQKTLHERGLTRPFTGSEDMRDSWSYPPLNDTFEAANRVRGALAERGWDLH